MAALLPKVFLKAFGPLQPLGEGELERGDTTVAASNDYFITLRRFP